MWPYNAIVNRGVLALVKEFWVQILAVITIITTSLALLGQWCYWGTFDVDFLSYLGFSEILNASLEVIGVFVIVTTITAIWRVVRGLFQKNLAENFSPLLEAFISSALIIGVLVIIRAPYILKHKPERILLVMLVVGVGTAYNIYKNDFLKGLVKNNFLRYSLFEIIFISIGAIVGVRSMEARKITDNVDVRIVSRIIMDGKNDSTLIRYRFVGLLGNKIVLCDASGKRVTLLQSSNVSLLQLEHSAIHYAWPSHPQHAPRSTLRSPFPR